MLTYVRAWTLILVGLIGGLAWGTSCSKATAHTEVQPVPILRALLAHDLPSGTPGGANTGGVWTTRSLNTEVYDPDNIVVLSGDEFMLQTGTYLIEAGQTIFAEGPDPRGFRGRLLNVTAGTTAALSVEVRLDVVAGQSATVVSPVPSTLVTLTAPATFQLQYFCETANAQVSGLGYSLATGEAERYAFVSIQKLN